MRLRSERPRNRGRERSYIFHCKNSSSLLIHGSLGNAPGFVENIFSFLLSLRLFRVIKTRVMQSSPSRFINSNNINYYYIANYVSYNRIILFRKKNTLFINIPNCVGLCMHNGVFKFGIDYQEWPLSPGVTN